MDFANFALTLLFAFVFGTLGYRLKIPAGAMVGAVVGTVLVNLLFERTFFFADLRVAIQLVSGVMIGSRIGKKDFLSLRTIVVPTLFLLGGMVIFNLTFGILMHRIGGLDVATALFSTAPGGMADMALISAELGAETAYVGILQMFRILVIILTTPPLFKRILQKRGYRSKRQETIASAEVGQPEAMVVPMRLLILLFVAEVGGLFFRWLGVTAGALTGGMLTSALYCVLRGTVEFPSALKFLLQILAGAYIGIGIDRACVATMISRQFVTHVRNAFFLAVFKRYDICHIV